MEVEVIDGLTAARSIVDDDAEPTFERAIERQPIRGLEDPPEQPRVLGPQVEHRGDVAFGDQRAGAWAPEDGGPRSPPARRSWCTNFAGIAPVTILQNTQSPFISGSSSGRQFRVGVRKSTDDASRDSLRFRRHDRAQRAASLRRLCRSPGKTRHRARRTHLLRALPGAHGSGMRQAHGRRLRTPRSSRRRRGARPREERRDGRTARSRRAALSRRRRIRRRRGRARGAHDRQRRASERDRFGSRSVRPRALLSADRQCRGRAGGEARSGGLPPGRRAAAPRSAHATSTRASASPSRTLRKGSLPPEPPGSASWRCRTRFPPKRSAMPTASILPTPRSTGERSRNSSPESSAAGKLLHQDRRDFSSRFAKRQSKRRFDSLDLRDLQGNQRQISLALVEIHQRQPGRNALEKRSCVARISRPVPRGSPRGRSSGSPCRQLFRRRQRDLAEVVRFDPQWPIELGIVVLVGDRSG